MNHCCLSSYCVWRLIWMSFYVNELRTLDLTMLNTRRSTSTRLSCFYLVLRFWKCPVPRKWKMGGWAILKLTILLQNSQSKWMIVLSHFLIAEETAHEFNAIRGWCCRRLLMNCGHWTLLLVCHRSCAHQYETNKEMSAAALAYKCMEVACMRVVYCRSLSLSGEWNELQKMVQMTPQGKFWILHLC